MTARMRIRYWLLALGAGAFALLALTQSAHAGFASARKSTYPAGGTHPAAVAVADFAADGRADVAVGNRDSDNISVLLANSRGVLSPSFGSPFFNPGETGPVSIATQDFNNDGFADIAVAYGQTGDVSTLLGDGRGRFTAVPSSNSRLAPVSIAPADFNQDGRVDLAVSRRPNTVSVLLGNGQGNLTAVSSVGTGGVGVGGVATADYNRDGKADVAVANGNSGDVSILLGDGHGGLARAPGMPTESGGSFPNAGGAGDFNGDGKADVATSNLRTGDSSLLLGNGVGAITPAAASPFPTGGFHPVAITAGEVNGDRREDVAIASSSGDISVLLGTSGGALLPVSGSPFVSGGFHPTSVAIGDVNGDGHNDVVVGNNSGDVSVLMNRGSVIASSGCSITRRPVTMKRGRVRIKVICPGRITARLLLRAHKGHATLGSKRFRVRRAGRALNVSVKLTRNGRALVQLRHRVRADVTVTSRKVGTKSSKRTNRTLTIRG